MNNVQHKLILASASARRRELLTEAGYCFDVIVPFASAEQGGEHLPPEQFVVHNARQKAADVAADLAEGLVLGCDTVAECDGKILGKPAIRDDALAMLQTLRGRRHRVLSGICLWHRPTDLATTDVAVTTLVMHNLTDQQIDDYLDSGAWQGKAGAFGLQDRLGWIEVEQGSESNVVGLPLELLANMLDIFSESNRP